MPSFQPNPFGARHVNQRPENRTVTDVKVAAQIFRGKLAGSIQRQTICPLGVIKQMLDVY